MTIPSFITYNKALYLFTFLFFFAFINFNLSMFGSGISVNYSFVLIALILTLVQRGLFMPPLMIWFAVAVFCFIFFSTLEISEIREEPSSVLRQLFGFVAFMTVFCFCFVRIEGWTIEAFVLGMIGAGLYYTAESLFSMFTMGAIYEVKYGDILFEPSFFFLKNVMGNSRVGFIIVAAFFLLLLKIIRKEIDARFGSILLALLFIGITTTFSRSAIVSFGGALLVFLFASATDKIKIKFDSDIRAGFVLFVLSCTIFGMLHPMVPAFYIDRLLHLFLGTEILLVGDLTPKSSTPTVVSPATSNPLSLKLSDPSSSEGFRVSLWNEIIEYANDKPVTGSGFVGVWSLSKLGIGSSHSDFFDVLFRTGYLGLVSYLALLIFVAIKLLKRNLDLLIVLAAFLIFGIFHEAFKEAHGRTALAFLLGVACASFNEGATDDHRH